MESTDELEDFQLSKDQRELLEYNFQKVSKQPDESTLTLIALECDLSEELAAKWFKLRYGKWRQSQGLPPVCGSVKD
ncbi:homeodomain-only protein [Erpetoichthys calabaricus]|uniref:homeodomain-only protein n=1 Tax=Erpetoichthys calabaricus TaxID=27687 RepID=UPI002234A638|nr:homeodomain-only protein [Erpetoichthys calabaricus]